MSLLPHQSHESATPGSSLAPRSIAHPDDYFQRQGVEPSRVKLDVQYESPEEMQSRLRREEAELTARLERERAESTHKRRKETSVYGVAILSIATLVVVSLYTLAADGETYKDDRAKAWSTLTAISTAVVGYLFGKNSSSQG